MISTAQKINGTGGFKHLYNSDQLKLLLKLIPLKPEKWLHFLPYSVNINEANKPCIVKKHQLKQHKPFKINLMNTEIYWEETPADPEDTSVTLQNL